MAESVFLRRVSGYAEPALTDAVAALLDATGLRPCPGARVLVKPNLVAPRNMGLSCTTPAVVRAVCRHLLHLGAQVTVADSPAFGTGRVVARLAGIHAALADLPVTITDLGSPKSMPLSCGARIGVSQKALCADHIVNVPRLKCHDQMGMTGGVKNLFGCVVGFRKSLAHQRFGAQQSRFARMILDVLAMLPPVTTLLDGIVAMHRHGPINGEPFPLQLLAASQNPVTLDTAIFHLLGLTPAQVPLWAEAQTMGLVGSDPDSIDYPLEGPDAFCTDGFLAPGAHAPIAFAPKRFISGRIRSVLTRWRRH